MPKVAKPKKAKPNHWDYSTWGVASRGYTLHVNPNWIYEEGPYVIDVENYKDGRFAGLGVYAPNNPYKEVYYWTDLNNFPKTHFFKHILIGHVLRTDIQKLKKWGFEIDDNRVHYDTALIEHLQDSTKMKYGLKELVKAKFGIEYPSYEKIVGDGDFDSVPVDVAANYNGMDLISTYELYKSQTRELAESKIYKGLIWPLGQVLTSMEERGLKIDLPYLDRLQMSLGGSKAELEADLYKELGAAVNLNSPKQLLEALNVKGITPKYKGKASVDKRGLRSLEQTPVISQLLGFSELETLLSSFVTPLLEQGRSSEAVIRAFFSQTATRTGRLACYRPNLQQIPTHTEKGREVKKAFVARPGFKLVELDYSAIEPRLLAHFSKSRALVQLFKSGTNFHDYTASRLGIDRQKAKVLNLSTGYRATKYGLAYQLKCSTEQAEKQLNDWWALWPDLYLWEELLIAKTRKTGFVETLYGRRIFIDNLDSKEKKLRETAERRVIENTAQGSVSDLIGLAMIQLDKEGLLIINQVHDSLVFEFPENKIDEYIQKACVIMTTVLSLEVPVEVEVKIGNTWGSMEKYELVD